jgi:flagellar basal-body rod protein FlgC
VYGSLDISTSALVANRTRLDAIAANLASAQIGGNPNGPNKPPSIREVTFALGDPESASAEAAELGVHVADIREVQAWEPRFEPMSELADEKGYVWYPAINPVVEMANMMVASRSYEANIAAIEAKKSMTSLSLELLA